MIRQKTVIPVTSGGQDVIFEVAFAATASYAAEMSVDVALAFACDAVASYNAILTIRQFCVKYGPFDGLAIEMRNMGRVSHYAVATETLRAFRTVAFARQ